MKVNKVNVESRRSVKVGTEFLTFTAGLEAFLEEGENEVDVIRTLYKTAGEEVDKQIEEAFRDLS